jgi:hypothetical protein
MLLSYSAVIEPLGFDSHGTKLQGVLQNFS